MNRLAACAVAWICVSSFACKSAETPPPAPPPPPPPPTSEFPSGCNPVQDSTVIIPVDTLASVPPAQECPVLALDAKVVWQGSNAVKTLVVGWKPKSASCSQPPLQNPICTFNSCSFDTSQVVTKVDLTLCYGVAAVDSSGNSVIKDPRLIIRGRV